MEIEAPFGIANRLGECPVWDPRSARLWWVDIEGRAVWRGDPSTGESERFMCEGRPAAVALTTHPDLVLVAAEGELAWLRDGAFASWIGLEEIEGNRLNDGRVSPDGLLWVGSMHEDTSRGIRSGSLYRVTPDGTRSTVRTDIGVTNGLAFSPDGTWMYFADTFDDRIERYPYTSGELGPPELFADTAGLDGRPDGGCVDEDGGFWMAAVHGGRLYRFDPLGRVERAIELPVLRPTRPTFGGSGLATLFVTSIGARPGAPGAPSGLDGHTLALDVGRSGIAEPLFAPTRGTIL